MPVSVIAGLGNPGAEYRGTRHNIGYWVVDALAESVGARWDSARKLEARVAKALIAGTPVWLVKPLTYMNHSGRALAALARYHRLAAENFAVVYDEIQMDTGHMKITCKGSAGGHNGAADIIRCLGPGFTRMRVGIGGKPHPATDLSRWVLSRFAAPENIRLAEALPDILNALHYLVEVGPEKAMNQINTRTSNTSNESNKHQT